MRPVNETRLIQTLNYIQSYQKTKGKTPTYRQILRGCRYPSLGSVALDIKKLKERGLVEVDDSTGWNQIRVPDNLKTTGSHQALIVGAVHCGQPSPAIEDIEESVVLPDSIFGCSEHVILHAVGPSMIKRGIFDGDLLVIRRQDTADYGETVIAMLEDGETTCKVLAKKDDGQPYLMAANDTLLQNGKRKYDVYPTGEWRIYGIVDFVIHAPVTDELQ